ncbi:hypothetical protein GQ457_10G006470 [Hibiscus cannabinus]
MSEKHPSKVVVWVRLSGLPYKYYSKALFRVIAIVVGKVVKVDYSTKVGERGKFAIDGPVQKLEYEGLNNICFGCGIYGHAKENCTRTSTREIRPEVDKSGRVVVGENEPTPGKDSPLYGSWMVMDNRRRQSNVIQARNTVTMTRQEQGRGSRFASLEVEDSPMSDEVVMEHTLTEVVVPDGTSTNIVRNFAKGASSSSVPLIVLNEAYLQSNPGKKNKIGRVVAASTEVLPLITGQAVDMVERVVQGPRGVHAAVTII